MLAGAHGCSTLSFRGMASNSPTAQGSARARLRAALHEEYEFLARLIKQADDPDVTSAQFVDLAEQLESIDFHVEDLIAELREETSGTQRRKEERSIRQFVLFALDGVKAPQAAAFLHDYLWARERVDMDTRGFSALRRDERRSWERNPGRRLAYIVPALTADGTAVPQLMARSDWSLEQRLLIPDDGRLFHLRALKALLAAHGEVQVRDAPDPFQPLIEKCAHDAFGDELQLTSEESTSRADALVRLRGRVDAEYTQVVAAAARELKKTATALRSLPEAQQLWGSS
jgi:hypothetical protein